MFNVFINWVCAIVFSLIGFSCLKSKRPAGFWSGMQVRKEQVTNVRKYNIANGILWMSYSLIYWIAGLCSIIDTGIGVIFTIVGCTAGIAYLLLGYAWIKRRFFVEYRERYMAGKLNDYK